VDDVVQITEAKWRDEAQARGVQIEVEADLQPVPLVAGNPSEVREVLTNLILNAVDAMPQGGRLTIRTGVADDGRAEVSVEDTGVGMSDEVRRRIFAVQQQ